MKARIELLNECASLLNDMNVDISENHSAYELYRMGNIDSDHFAESVERHNKALNDKRDRLGRYIQALLILED